MSDEISVFDYENAQRLPFDVTASDRATATDAGVDVTAAFEATQALVSAQGSSIPGLTERETIYDNNGESAARRIVRMPGAWLSRILNERNVGNREATDEVEPPVDAVTDFLEYQRRAYVKELALATTERNRRLRTVGSGIAVIAMTALIVASPVVDKIKSFGKSQPVEWVKPASQGVLPPILELPESPTITTLDTVPTTLAPISPPETITLSELVKEAAKLAEAQKTASPPTTQPTTAKETSAEAEKVADDWGEILAEVYCGTPEQRNWKIMNVENMKIVQEVAAKHGWHKGRQWAALQELIACESGGDMIYNEIGAGGIPQAYPANKMAAAGEDWETNPRTQARWMLDMYIPNHDSFSNPVQALAYHYRYNAY